MQGQKPQAVQDDAEEGGVRPRQDTMADPLEAELGEGTVFGKKEDEQGWSLTGLQPGLHLSGAGGAGALPQLG